MAPLSNATLKFLRDKLMRLQAELEVSASDTTDATQTVDLDAPIGRLTRIDAIQRQEMARANVQAAKLRLQQVAAALKAMDEGNYGECWECGEEIAEKRLEARPESQLCIECQAAREKR